MTQGTLIYLVGSSGSGKDTILHAIIELNLPFIYVIKRHITRAVTSNEAHYTLTEAEFLKRQQQQFFALSWEAHGLYYGIDHQFETELDKGKTVIMNGSRAYLKIARQQYPQLIPVCLNVDKAILRERLIERGRDSTADIDQRLARHDSYYQSLPEDTHYLNNNTSIEDTITSFLAMLDSFNNPSNHLT